MGLFSPVIHKYLEAHNEHAVGRLLDVGCGDKPHQGVFPEVTTYIGLDRPSKPHEESPGGASRVAAIDLHGLAEALPFKELSFDTVLASQVIEHLPEPLIFLKETARVLKTGGKLIVTFPLINPVHESPYDFFRYTSYGMEHLCAKAGLRCIVSVAMGGGWLTVGYLARLLLSKEAETSGTAWSRLWRRRVGSKVYQLMQTLDRKRTHHEFTLNYLMIAVK